LYQKQEFPRRNEGQNRINDRIRVSQVRLVDQNGNQVGIVSIQEALQKAQFAALDLVEIAPAAQPPVCRIMNYGKFLYEQQKKEKDARKKQHVMQLKEIKVSPRTSDHDYGYRMKQAREFLGDGNKVRVTVTFKGRELSHTEFGHKIIEKFREDLQDIGQEERQGGEMMGKLLFTVFTPKKAGGSHGKSGKQPESRGCGKTEEHDTVLPNSGTPADSVEVPATA